MFNQGDLRMAKAQQERLLAQARKQDGRAQRPNFLAALIRRLTGVNEKEVTAKISRKPAEAQA